MKIRHVVLKKWPFPKNTKAVTIYPFIFYREKPTWMNTQHEMVHIAQIEDLGWFKFYGSYLVDYIKKGYKNNKYEREARKKSKKRRRRGNE